MTPNEEILQIIRYAPGPIGASAIYEQCKSVETISDVSSRLSQLFNQGKLKREEITTPNNRKAFAYSIPKPGEAESAAPAASAPAAAPGASAEQPAPVAPARSGKPRKQKPGDAKAIGKALDQVAAALKDSPPLELRAPIDAALPGFDAERLADAILGKTREQLAPGLEGGPLWWINQDGCLEVADRGDPVMLIEFTREQALLMAEMVIGTNNLLGHL